MTENPKTFRHILVATPGDEFYIRYDDENDPLARKRFSLNMTRAGIIEHCNTQWPGKYSEADIDLKIATVRRSN